MFSLPQVHNAFILAGPLGRVTADGMMVRVTHMDEVTTLGFGLNAHRFLHPGVLNPAELRVWGSTAASSSGHRVEAG